MLDPALRARALATLEDLRRCRAALDSLDLALPAAHADLAIQLLRRELNPEAEWPLPSNAEIEATWPTAN